MKVEIYISPSCPHREEAGTIVREAVAESGQSASIDVISVGDYEEAKSKRMFGSPTIRVDGMDVEYGDREPEEYSTGCRFYNTPDGWKPLPRKELVQRGIETALRRQQAAQRQQ